MIRTDTVRDRARERQLTAGNVFSVAIANLRKLGWVQGTYHATTPGQGSVCLMGAVENAIGKLLNLDFNSHEDMLDTTFLVSDYLRFNYPLYFNRLSPQAWNDRTARNVDEVIAVLEHIATNEASTPFDHLLT